MSASSRVSVLLTLLIAVLVLAACASESASVSRVADTGQRALEPISTATAAVATPLPPPTATARPLLSTQDDQNESDPTMSANEQDEDDLAENPEPVAGAGAEDGVTEPSPLPQPSATPDAPTPQCVRLTDFTVDAENLSWFIVNDNVMGGQSSGGPTFDGAAMVFDGEINTDGGGFSSVRVQLGADTLTGFGKLKVRARTDGRAYKVILEDNLSSRDRRVSQQGSLDFSPSVEWQTVEIAFAVLEPRIFGRAVQTEAFRPDLATQLGVMISDGVDGPFRIEIDWIDACV